ncbi:MAG: hypothetical protein U1E65_03320 [Myxococcota bacterium]
MSAENPFETPQAAPLPPTAATALPWFAVGKNKLLIMTITTFGLYTIHWFERHYRRQKLLRNESTMPLARGIFSIFFANELFTRVHFDVETSGIMCGWKAKDLATIFIASAVVGRLIDRTVGNFGGVGGYVGALIGLGLLGGLAFPIVKVQESVNALLAQRYPGFDPNDRFTVWNWLLIVIGSLLIITTLLSPLIQ